MAFATSSGKVCILGAVDHIGELIIIGVRSAEAGSSRIKGDLDDGDNTLECENAKACRC